MKRIYISETVDRIGEKVKLNGWLAVKRDHGKILFIDLRDKSGVIQVVISGDAAKQSGIDKAKVESVIEIEGTVKNRPEHLVNKDLETGSVECEAESVKVISFSDDVPFEIEKGKGDVSEEVRLKYRYLDLRRPKMQANIKLRSQVIKFIRDYLTQDGFNEIETPYIGKSTPEGARDYLIPSRLQHGKFYALPQSPQQYKQLLMVAGFEKYFQIVRCFRDEDTRGDRQAEFTQLDMEMSFVQDNEDVLGIIEGMLIKLVETVTPEKKITQIPFPRITYREAMEKYGSDKPDLRVDKNNPNELAFAFIIDFPMFEKSKETGRWTAVHHPFTMPKITSIDEMKNDPASVIAKQYDIALNGYEVGGGSIRTHNPEILQAVFEVLGHEKEEIEEQFGHLLQAFKYGVPPHGGIAPGIDRLLMILADEPNIREVIAFPKTGDGRDLMMEAPSLVSNNQLRELGIQVVDKWVDKQ